MAADARIRSHPDLALTRNLLVAYRGALVGSARRRSSSFILTLDLAVVTMADAAAVARPMGRPLRRLVTETIVPTFG